MVVVTEGERGRNLLDQCRNQCEKQNGKNPEVLGSGYWSPCHAFHSVTTAGSLPAAPHGRTSPRFCRRKQPRGHNSHQKRLGPWAYVGAFVFQLTITFSSTKPLLSVSEKHAYRQHMFRSQNWEMALYLTRFPTDKTCSNCGVIGWCSIAMNSVFRTMQMVMAKSTKGSITIKFTISFSFIQ